MTTRLFSHTIAVLCAVGLASSSHASVESVTIELIPNAASANDMSPDGRFVVGEKSDGSQYIWNAVTGVMTTLPGPGYGAIAISDDGQVVLGEMNDLKTGAPVAAIWRASTNTWTSLGYLPNANACPSLSSPYELSADGSVAVGLSWDGCSGRAFRWTEATGMVELEPLANGGNRASVLSADGNHIGGFAQGSFSRTPAYWDGTTTDGTLLDPPAGDALGEIYAFSDDGAVMLGTWNGDAVMWAMPSVSMSVIGPGSILPGWEGIPQDIADNGTVVGFDFLAGNRRAWIQPNGNGGLIELEAYIEAHGGTLPPGLVSLHVCQAISTNGRTIIGHGFQTGAWLVRITPGHHVCTGDLVSSDTFQPPPDGTIDGADLAYLLGEWGKNPGSPADMVTSKTFQPPPDGLVDGADLAALLGAWGACE